jgi:hypothetical protein
MSLSKSCEMRVQKAGENVTRAGIELEHNRNRLAASTIYSLRQIIENSKATIESLKEIIGGR